MYSTTGKTSGRGSGRGVPAVAARGRMGRQAGKCCPACCGIGSHFGTEWIHDNGSISMYKRVTVRKDCEICAGSGRVEEMEGAHTLRCVVPAVTGRRDTFLPMPGRFIDQALVYLLSLVFFGFLLFQLMKQEDGSEALLKTGGAIGLTLFVAWSLVKLTRATRTVGRIALFLCFLALCLGVAMEFARG